MEILAAFGLLSLIGIITSLWITYINFKKSKETIVGAINQAERLLFEDLQKMDLAEFYKTDPGLELLSILEEKKNTPLEALHKKQDFPSVEIMDDELYQKLFGEKRSSSSTKEHIHFSNKLPRIELIDDEIYQRLFGLDKGSLPKEEHLQSSQQLPKIEKMDEDLYQKLFGNQETTSPSSENEVESQIGDKSDLSGKIRHALREIGLLHIYKRNDKTYTFDVPFQIMFSPKNEVAILRINKNQVPRNYNLNNINKIEEGLSKTLGLPVSVQSLNDTIVILLHIENYVTIEEKQRRTRI